MFISFAWTTPALLAGAKTITRRSWSASHASRFRAGTIVDAWDRLPRTGRGHKVTSIRITRDPWQQRTSEMDDVTDYEREGLRWLDLNGHRLCGHACTHGCGRSDTSPRRWYRDGPHVRLKGRRI